MATEAEMRFCTDPSTSRRPLPALESLVDAIQAAGDGDLTFRGFRVVESGRLDPVHQSRDRIDRAQLLAELGPWDSPAHRLSTRTTIRRYEADPDTDAITETLVATWIGSSGGAHRGRTGDWWLDGDAAISISSAVPYRFPTLDGVPVRRPDVARNVDHFVALLEAGIAALGPVAAKVHTDAGEPFPFNAHAAYFARAEHAIRDLDAIRDLFTLGHPVLGLPPLGDVDDDDELDLAFHLWRSADERRQVQGAFRDAVKRGSRVDPDDVLSAATTDGLVFEPSGAGFLVATDATWFNSFLDPFYLRAFGVA
jgi:hypothetical protein